MAQRVRRLLAVLGVAICAGCIGTSAGKLTEGPLRDTDGNASVTSGPVTVGQFFAIGVFLPANKSGHDAVLESLKPADSERARGLRLRYAAVRLPDPTCQIGSATGWPPQGCSGHLKPVSGFRYRNGEYSAEVLVGARSLRPGVWFIPSFRLRYELGGHHYAAVYFEGMKFHVSPRGAVKRRKRS